MVTISFSLAVATSSSTARSSSEKVSSRSQESTWNSGLRNNNMNVLNESLKILSETEPIDDEDKGATAATGKFLHKLHLFKFFTCINIHYFVSVLNGERCCICGNK